MASNKVLINRIRKMIEKMSTDVVIYPHLDFTETVSDGKGIPSFKVTTDYQIISIDVNESGEIITTSRMRRGAGSEKDFNRKVEALDILRKYVKKKFKGFVVKETFDNIKVTTDDKILTLTVDPKTKEVVIKERARRGTKEKASVTESFAKEESKVKESKPKISKSAKTSTNGIEVKEDVPLVQEVKEPEVAEKPKKSTFKLKPSKRIDPKDIKIKEDFVQEHEYEHIPEGTSIKNIYNNKTYKVIHDGGNVLEVFDPQYGYLTMARSDTKVVKKKDGK